MRISAALDIAATDVDLTGATAGGTWSGNGITNAANGTFDPATATKSPFEFDSRVFSGTGNTPPNILFISSARFTNKV